MRKITEKGQPNFSNLNYDKLREYRDVVNEMIGAFSEFPEEKEVLTKVWKALSCECADRLCALPEAETPKKRLTVFKRSKSVKLGLDKF